MAWASIVIFICWLTSYSNKTMLSLGWVMATKRLRWSTWTGWPSRNVHSSNGNGSFPFTQIVFFSLFLQLTFRTWLWEKGTAYTSRVAVSLLLFMSSLCCSPVEHTILCFSFVCCPSVHCARCCLCLFVHSRLPFSCM
jgi:hypothetical protein